MKSPSELLSICIPTYNRAEILRECLEDLIPKVEPLSIPVIVSDNASSDHTGEIVATFQKRYPLIVYSRNPENIHENNFPTVLNLSSTRFSWLFADTEKLVDGAVELVLDAASETDEYNMIVVNGGRRSNDGNGVDAYVRNVPDSVYTDRNKLLAELGWYTTWVSALVYGRSIIKEGNFHKYLGTDFIQLGGIYDYLAKNSVNVRWIARPLVVDTATEAPKYYARLIEIFVIHWVNIICFLPDTYSLGAKLKCIKSLDENIHIFSFSRLLYVRYLGGYDLAVHRRIKDKIPLVTRVPRCCFWVSAVIPIRLLKIAIGLKRIIMG